MTKEKDGLHKLTDDELVFLVQYLHQDPFETLLERYSPLIGNIVRKVKVNGFDEEDLLQEARIVFHRVVLRYKNDKGMTLGMFFKLSLQNHVYSLVRNQQAHKRKGEQQAASLNGMTESGWIYPVEYRVAEKDSPLAYVLINDSLESFIDTLSGFEKEVFCAYIESRSVEEVASDLNCQVDKIKNALVRCKNKLKSHLDN